jgi:hypothetical protein
LDSNATLGTGPLGDQAAESAGLNIGQDARGKKFEIDPSVLTKHALVLGATGSGKTVFCKAIIEEAALKGIPVLAIDPKGDIACLAIASKDFQFRPYSDVEADAAKVPREEYAQDLQSRYLKRTREAGITAETVAKFTDTVDVRIYTPKSSAGIPVSISPRLDPPPCFQEMVKNEPNVVLDLLDLSVTSLLRIVRPRRDDRRAASYLSQILRDQWNKGESVDLSSLIDLVQRPPFASISGIKVDQYYSRKERLELAKDLSRFNIDPRLQGWTQGEPLNIDQLFQTGAKTPVNVIYLRGIQTDEERSFFVETLLRQLYGWMRRQRGVQNLRFLLYFDEVYGYCPPSNVKEPPSKKGLILLIKQARAFGLGIILATQNPGDVDYKALGNVNVLSVGRLATQVDIDKVKLNLDLPEDSALTIATLEREKFLCQIGDPRTSAVVSPRWLITYHRGPLQDDEVSQLMKGRREGGPSPPQQVSMPVPDTTPPPTPQPPPVDEAEQVPSTPAEPSPVPSPLGIPFSLRQKEVPERVKKQKRLFGPTEVVVQVRPIYRPLLELGISLKTGVLTKTHQTKYAFMDAVTGKIVDLERKLVLLPGLETVIGLGSRDTQVLRGLPDNKYTSPVELAGKMKLQEDLIRDSLRTLEAKRLAKSARIGNAKVYQRIVNVPSLDLKDSQANVSPLEFVEMTPLQKGRSEVELREVIRGLRDDYDLVSYRPFYYPLYSVDLAFGNRARTVWIDGVTGEDIQL